MRTEDASRVTLPVPGPGLIGLYALTTTQAASDGAILILDAWALNGARGREYLDAAMERIRGNLPDVTHITWLFDGPYQEFPQDSLDKWLFFQPERV